MRPPVQRRTFVSFLCLEKIWFEDKSLGICMCDCLTSLVCSNVWSFRNFSSFSFCALWYRSFTHIQSFCDIDKRVFFQYQGQSKLPSGWWLGLRTQGTFVSCSPLFGQPSRLANSEGTSCLVRHSRLDKVLKYLFTSDNNNCKKRPYKVIKLITLITKC